MNGGVRSLKSRIIGLVIGCLAAVLVPLVILSYIFMMEEVDELSDARLAQNARTISALADEIGGHPASVGDHGKPVEIANWRRRQQGEALTVHGHRYETQIGFQYWSSANVLLMSSANLAAVALDAAPAGFADIAIDGRHWRVFTLLAPDKTWIRVGERYDSRREIARALAVEAIAPLLVGVPLLMVLVGWAVQRGLLPLRHLAERIGERRPEKTDPLGIVDAPAELEPVVAALNGLLGRLRGLLEHEREFTANAAHELRTPLAGALIHVENARAAHSPADAALSMQQAQRGLDRLARIVSQMLELARWDAHAKHELNVVDLRACVTDEIANVSAQAAGKDLEVVFDGDEAVRFITGWEPGIRTLLRNLLDNAVRYSNVGGRIDLHVEGVGDATRLTISDSGPGIGAERRGAVLERFQRGNDGLGEGSGLGLAIVARVAQLHRTRLVLGDVEGRSGLRVQITFARAAPSNS